MGAIMDVSIGKEHSKGPPKEADNALMVSSSYHNNIVATDGLTAKIIN